MHILITCEHATHVVPTALQAEFRGARQALRSHRGHDIGALPVAKQMAKELEAPLVCASVSRLVIDANRSLHHPRLFSEWTRGLPDWHKADLIRTWWEPHRRRVEAFVEELSSRSGPVLHFGVHSFTPVLDGVVRDADLALLYDPSRELEARFAREWSKAPSLKSRGFRLRRNYPYRGISDGLTTALRRSFSKRKYLGFEIEMNQELFAQRGRARELASVLVDAIRSSVRSAIGGQ
ncbi:MAG: N-formylglutamate amidohydrolase [Myxococcales bacterium]|nr:N-formylglutamate amidohydrolase [Myxococcales bacterium]